MNFYRSLVKLLNQLQEFVLVQYTCTRSSLSEILVCANLSFFFLLFFFWGGGGRGGARGAVF